MQNEQDYLRVGLPLYVTTSGNESSRYKSNDVKINSINFQWKSIIKREMLWRESLKSLEDWRNGLAKFLYRVVVGSCQRECFDSLVKYVM